jgi:hypothetical protein
VKGFTAMVEVNVCDKRIQTRKQIPKQSDFWLVLIPTNALLWNAAHLSDFHKIPILQSFLLYFINPNIGFFKRNNNISKTDGCYPNCI